MNEGPRIGVLTSGGDAPGMNAAIRTVVRTVLSRGGTAVGIQRGYHGLVCEEFIDLNSRSVADTVQRGGTILKSARSEVFLTDEGQEKAVQNLRKVGIDALVVIGGDGSLRGAEALSRRGFPAIGVPATIDNDISCTDVSIGFDTAVNTVVDAMNKIRDTATSHERTYVVEVMGRHSGFIALWSGLAGGAESILIPEVPYDIADVCDRIVEGHSLGKAHSIVVVAEGLDGDLDGHGGESAGFRIGRQIRERTGFEVRITVLGHLQRGGNPTASDRILASRLAFHAVDLAMAGQSSKMVGIVHNQVRAFSIAEVVKQKKTIDRQFYDLAQVLSSL